MAVCYEVEPFLAVGRTVMFQLKVTKQISSRYRTAIRGWQRGKYIMLDTVIVSDTAVMTGINEICILRFMHEGQVCAFESQVIDSIAGKRPYFRVAWPRDLEQVSVRRHERVRVSLPCTLERAGAESVEAEVRDMSAGGCCVESRVPFEKDQELRLTCVLPDGVRVDRLRVLVRACNLSDRRYVLGLQYKPVREDDLQDLEFFVSSVLERMRGMDGGACRVLFVGADSVDLVKMRSRMENLGYEVIAADGVVDAFYRLRLMPPQAVFINHEQSELAGTEICRVIRNARGLDTLPVFMYGGAGKEAGPAARAAGATRYFPKIEAVAEILQALQPRQGVANS